MYYYSKQFINEIREIDLLTYLKNYEPDELVKINDNNYCTKTHDSLKISNGKWNWFSRGFGGVSALDYLIKVKNYSFMDAVKIISDSIKKCEPIKYKQLENTKETTFKIPKKNENNDKIISYLIGRGIDKDLIYECIDNDLLYEEKDTHNVVFMGFDINKKPRYAAIRATNNSRFMHESPGSHKAFSFKLEAINQNDTVHIFESAIDLLSYATLLKMDNKEWYNENLLSLAGVYKPQQFDNYKKIPIAINLYLNNNPNIKKIVLHLDNDDIGRSATKALTKSLEHRYIIVDDPPKSKDVNDFLCEKLGIKRVKKKEMER